MKAQEFDLKNAYEQFFVKSEGGQRFVANLNSFINQHHLGAEDNPELAIAHTQRAAGMREILSHIQMVITPKKEAKPKQ